MTATILKTNNVAALKRVASPITSNTGKTSSTPVPSIAAACGGRSGTWYSYRNRSTVVSKSCREATPDFQKTLATHRRTPRSINGRPVSSPLMTGATHCEALSTSVMTFSWRVRHGYSEATRGSMVPAGFGSKLRPGADAKVSRKPVKSMTGCITGSPSAGAGNRDIPCHWGRRPGGLTATASRRDISSCGAGPCVHPDIGPGASDNNRGCPAADRSTAVPRWRCAYRDAGTDWSGPIPESNHARASSQPGRGGCDIQDAAGQPAQSVFPRLRAGGLHDVRARRGKKPRASARGPGRLTSSGCCGFKQAQHDGILEKVIGAVEGSDLAVAVHADDRQSRET